MSGSGWTILAYAIGLSLMWGYAATLWLASRSLHRRKGV